MFSLSSLFQLIRFFFSPFPSPGSEDNKGYNGGPVSIFLLFTGLPPPEHTHSYPSPSSPPPLGALSTPHRHSPATLLNRLDINISQEFSVTMCQLQHYLAG